MIETISSKIFLYLFGGVVFSFFMLTLISDRYLISLSLNPANIISSGIDENKDCKYFNSDVLTEASSPEESGDKCWWLDSGASFSVLGGIGKTVLGELATTSFWRIKYETNNPADTDEGFHPQNIFRLVNKNKWQDSNQEVLFKIDKYNLSQSKNRNESNGVLLMSHYLDADNLYYAGLRVDGFAVIKKKINGKYITLGEKKYSNVKYNKQSGLVSLPMNKWIGEKLETKNNSDDTVELILYVDLSGSGEWQELLDLRDSLRSSGAPPLISAGNTGIRSDFMDVEFSNYKVEKI